MGDQLRAQASTLPVFPGAGWMLLRQEGRVAEAGIALPRQTKQLSPPLWLSGQCGCGHGGRQPVGVVAAALGEGEEVDGDMGVFWKGHASGIGPAGASLISWLTSHCP